MIFSQLEVIYYTQKHSSNRNVWIDEELVKVDRISFLGKFYKYVMGACLCHIRFFFSAVHYSRIGVVYVFFFSIWLDCSTAFH